MKQLTIRGIDTELEARLRHCAEQAGTSLNKAAIRLMRRGADLEGSSPVRRTVGRSLDAYIGSWSEDEAAQFNEAVKVFDTIDEDLWK